jgi:hypothetical protein
MKDTSTTIVVATAAAPSPGGTTRSTSSTTITDRTTDRMLFGVGDNRMSFNTSLRNTR